MDDIFPEKNYDPIFERFGLYFYGTIRFIGCEYLLYNRRDRLYVPPIRDFYNGFKVTNFDLGFGRLQFTWGGVEHIISMEDISALIDFP